jgi:hypothetical protein
MDYVIVLAVVAMVAMFVTVPLRRARADARGVPGVPAQDPLGAHALEELVAAREAKYREIRDAELDHRTGKLSDEDYAAVDATLRAEAIAILDALERLPSDAR